MRRSVRALTGTILVLGGSTASGGMLACRSSSSTDEALKPSEGFVPFRGRNGPGYILSAGAAAKVYGGHDEFFTPTPELAQSFEDQIERSGRREQGMGRLYAGFILDGHQALRVNFLCESFMRTHPWHRAVPMATEGGCVYHALFDVESRAVSWSTLVEIGDPATAPTPR